MAQYDVHRVVGSRDPNTLFVVVVQSSQYDRYRRRVVIPLKRKSLLPSTSSTLDSTLSPVFKIQATEVVLNPLEIVSVATERLGAKVGNLAPHKGRIVAALDELLTTAWE